MPLEISVDKYLTDSWIFILYYLVTFSASVCIWLVPVLNTQRDILNPFKPNTFMAAHVGLQYVFGGKPKNTIS